MQRPQTMMSKELYMIVSCKDPVKDMLTILFRLFQDRSSNVSPRPVITPKNKRIDWTGCTTGHR